MPFTITSASFADGAMMPHAQLYCGMGQTGANLSPALSWTGAPDGTRSFAITAYDPDAPTGSGWWHWLAINIPATVTSLPEGASLSAMPAGTLETRTDFGTPGYGGAAPPPNQTHRYIFTAHALKVEKIDLPADASGAMVGFMINANALATASITARFHHPG